MIGKINISKMESNYIYNNEAIATLAICSFLKVHQEIDISTSILILPFLLHEPTVRQLNSNSNKRSIEEFLSNYPESLVNFNTRILDLLPLSINAITILNDAEIIEIKTNKISYQNNRSFQPSKSGKRSERIIRASNSLSNLFMNEKESSLYLKLKVQL